MSNEKKEQLKKAISEMTDEQRLNAGRALFMAMNADLSKDGSEHLNIKLNLKQDDRLSDVENIKLKIVEDILSFYHKYPTLHSMCLIYNKGGYSSRALGWYPSVNQIAWDTVEKLKSSEEYKQMNVNIHAFCHNSMNTKKDLDIIPHAGGLTSRTKIEEELNHYFSYLIESDIGEKLYKKLQKERLDYKGLKDYINIEARTWDGWKNLRLEKDIKDFFGAEMTANLLKLNLEDKLPEKIEIRSKNKI